MNKAVTQNVFSELPPAPDYNPVAQAIKRAKELGEKEMATALGYFTTMPASTSIIANPVLHHVSVESNGTQITLDIRSFTIRGVLSEADIVKGKVTPAAIIFTGLFGRVPSPNEESAFMSLLDQNFFVCVGRDGGAETYGKPVIEHIADFVKEFPGLGPEVASQHFSTLRKAYRARRGEAEGGVNEEREPSALLAEMIYVHMENVAAGAFSAYMNYLLAENAQRNADDLAASTRAFIEEERKRGRNCFQTCYSLILTRHANNAECLIMERMGTIQTHHGSAGSNMVARYMATLHALSVTDFFTAAQMAMDGARHFGAIHDMTKFVHQLESLPADRRESLIREKVLGGGLPTFGHPEIAAAGRGNSVQQDPRPALYIDPMFKAIDSGELTLTQRQRERLAIAHQIYQVAFVKGVLKPQREHEPPLRLTANTDFGAWCVQEGLRVEEENRTLLTYIFRGFGWMMDAREQLQQKMIRPVIAPDPKIIPSADTDTTISDIVAGAHRRLTQDDPFVPH